MRQGKKTQHIYISKYVSTFRKMDHLTFFGSEKVLRKFDHVDLVLIWDLLKIWIPPLL